MKVPPATVRPGERLEYGLMTVEYRSNGDLEVCDPYGCDSFHVASREPVNLQPVVAVNRPSRVADCIYIELERSLAVNGTLTLWVLAPFELATTVSNTVLGVYTPVKAKYTIVGDIVDGYLCRYYRSLATADEGSLEAGEGEALLEVDVKGHGVLKGVGFYAAQAKLYRSNKAILYSRLAVNVSSTHAEARFAGAPRVYRIRLVEVPGIRVRGPVMGLQQVFTIPV